MIFLPFALIAAVAVCVVASFFVRRHGESTNAHLMWTQTTEVFRDPTTARLMRVWPDETGRCHYVAEGTLDSER